MQDLETPPGAHHAVYPASQHDPLCRVLYIWGLYWKTWRLGHPLSCSTVTQPSLCYDAEMLPYWVAKNRTRTEGDRSRATFQRQLGGKRTSLRRSRSGWVCHSVSHNLQTLLRCRRSHVTDRQSDWYSRFWECNVTDQECGLSFPDHLPRPRQDGGRKWAGDETKRYQTILSAAILLAEVVGRERD